MKKWTFIAFYLFIYLLVEPVKFNLVTPAIIYRSPCRFISLLQYTIQYRKILHWIMENTAASCIFSRLRERKLSKLVCFFFALIFELDSLEQRLSISGSQILKFFIFLLLSLIKLFQQLFNSILFTWNRDMCMCIVFSIWKIVIVKKFKLIKQFFYPLY